jgi:predicted DCC family thiol-disulfide oxidoreductase YuxK
LRPIRQQGGEALMPAAFDLATGGAAVRPIACIAGADTMRGVPIEVLYNGVCPVCRAGACDLERRAAAARVGVVFTDVAADPSALTRAGVTLDAVRLKLHAVTPDGRVLRGMPAVALAWSVTPPFRPLGRLSASPPFSWIAAGVYHLVAWVLWSWNRACGRW